MLRKKDTIMHKFMKVFSLVLAFVFLFSTAALAD